MKMKKILSILLSLTMVLSSATVFATENSSGGPSDSQGGGGVHGDGANVARPVVARPTATVTKLNVAEITEPKLTFALNFKADEVEPEQLEAYGDWYADFVLTVNKDVTLNASEFDNGEKLDPNSEANGYLAGWYDGWREMAGIEENDETDPWLSVPFEPITIEANETLRIMETAADMINKPSLKFTYNDVYESVKNFKCGVYFTPEFLADNEDLLVTLELRIYNPEDEEESYLIGEGYEFEMAHDVATDENVTVKADTVEETVVILDATVSGGAENVEKVTIDTTAVTEEKVTSVSIPKTTVESVKDIPVTPGEGESESEEGTALEIKLSDNEDADKSTVVTLDNAALNAIATAPEAASTDYLTIQVKKIEEHEEEEHLEDEQIETKENLADHHIYTINLVNSDGEDVPFTGGKVTIKLYYPQTQNGEVHVQHLTDEGELEEIYDFTYEAPFVTMTLEHFSEYVVYTKPVVVDDYEEPTDSYVPTYTVRFDTLGAGTIANQAVYRNETAEAPEEPVKEGYIFGGWYTDKACTNEYDFATKVNKNILLYAKWTEATAEDNTPSEDDKTDDTNKDDTNTGDDTAADWENNFADVKDSDWYYESVKYVCENGLMTGSSETEFNPNSNLTRAMLVTVLYRAEGEPEVEGTTAFVDVNADAYYAKAVVWGQKNGIINGYSDTEFAPDKNITREQIAAIIYRYAQFKGYDVSVGEDTNILSYDDALQISEYAVSAIQYTVGSKLINGKTASTLNPKDNATRAEIAAILQRFIEAQK